MEAFRGGVGEEQVSFWISHEDRQGSFLCCFSTGVRLWFLVIACQAVVRAGGVRERFSCVCNHYN